MTISNLFTITLACALFRVSAFAAAPNSATDDPRRELEAEIAALLAAQPTWSVSTALETQVGYKDNLLLSNAGEERSAFARGGVELFLLRLPEGRFDYSLFAQAERTHYFAGETIDHDADAWVQTELGYRLTENLHLSLPVTGYYSDQVFDVSDVEIERLVARLQVVGAFVGPTLRWAFHPAWWIETQAIAHRDRYEDGTNDSDVGEGAVRLGWILGERLEVRLSAARRWRDYEVRERYTSSGRAVAGTDLKIAEREAALRFDIEWDEAKRWQTSTTVGVLDYRDNGSGYFDYREQKVTHELEWSTKVWLVRIGGAARRLEFDVQKVGIGIVAGLPARAKDEFFGEVRIERKLTPRWTALAGYLWERSRSNDPIASYVVNEGLLGVRWSWEK